MRLCRQKDTPHICRCIYPYMNMFTHVYRGCIGITTLMWWVQGLGFCMCAWGCGQLSQTSLHSIPILYEKRAGRQANLFQAETSGTFSQRP